MGQSTEILCALPGRRRSQVGDQGGRLRGDLTRNLFGVGRGGRRPGDRHRPAPQAALEELAREQTRLELIRQTSLEALRHVPLPDAIVIDGDHNYYTVSQELALIGERAPGEDLPLLLFHDVCWPHGRRDDYFDPEQIPAGPTGTPRWARPGHLPENPGVDPRGLPYPSRPGRRGPGNGVSQRSRDSGGRAPGRPARGRARLLRPGRGLANPNDRAPPALPRCSIPSTAIRCSSAWRPAAYCNSRATTASRPSCGSSRGSWPTSGLCWTACSTRVPSPGRAAVGAARPRRNRRRHVTALPGGHPGRAGRPLLTSRVGVRQHSSGPEVAWRRPRSGQYRQSPAPVETADGGC